VVRPVVTGGSLTNEKVPSLSLGRGTLTNKWAAKPRASYSWKERCVSKK